ncbi:FAD-dependent oxidoreductase [Seleniivibrio sp.]|uniref:FAD-dependent oxidoreductase n=1 Tax=Seleniivibrio sp. TaxID=2898801 RepID=UPI0025DBCEE8|nr:FAD-dependent oxidoreductase [Seleniivibrio sp.]MCD8553592.1 FAD-dependent oxidoreductase [Seleniivibrio sp.]
MNFSRRDFIKTVGASAGIFAAAGIPAAHATILPEPKKKIKADVIVVGSGMAATCAALQAAELGVKTIMIEKLPLEEIGGSTKFSGGSIGVASEDTPESKQIFFEEIDKASLGRGNKEIMKVIAENSLENTRWIRSYGPTAPDPMYRPGKKAKSVIFDPGMYRNMRVVLAKLREAYQQKLKGQIHCDTKARQLLLNDKGEVIGVRAETKAGLVDYMGKVVLGTGGYARNKEMLEMYVGPDADEAWYRGSQGNTGDGHLMAKEIGAGLVRMGGSESIMLANVSPVNPHAGNPSYIVQYGLMINVKGKRYIDEGLGYGYVCPVLLNQPMQTAAMVFDSEMRTKFGAIDVMVKLFDTNKIPYVQADTLEGLAEKINVPKDEFMKTVQDYNAAVKPDGTAINLVPQKTNSAIKLEKGPYYAFYPLMPGITLTFGGININTDAQVMQADGRVIKGLYAAGECAGGVFHHEYYSVGLPLANAMTMGRIAGRNAAKLKL